MAHTTKTRRPLRAATGHLLIAGIPAREVAEAAGRGVPWVSMGLTGHIPWPTRLEAAILMVSDGDHELVTNVREAAIQARQYRLEDSK